MSETPVKDAPATGAVEGKADLLAGVKAAMRMRLAGKVDGQDVQNVESDDQQQLADLPLIEPDGLEGFVEGLRLRLQTASSTVQLPMRSLMANFSDDGGATFSVANLTDLCRVLRVASSPAVFRQFLESAWTAECSMRQASAAAEVGPSSTATPPLDAQPGLLSIAAPHGGPGAGRLSRRGSMKPPTAGSAGGGGLSSSTEPGGLELPKVSPSRAAATSGTPPLMQTMASITIDPSHDTPGGDTEGKGAAAGGDAVSPPVETPPLDESSAKFSFAAVTVTVNVAARHLERDAATDAVRVAKAKEFTLRRAVERFEKVESETKEATAAAQVKLKELHDAAASAMNEEEGNRIVRQIREEEEVIKVAAEHLQSALVEVEAARVENSLTAEEKKLLQGQRTLEAAKRKQQEEREKDKAQQQLNQQGGGKSRAMRSEQDSAEERTRVKKKEANMLRMAASFEQFMRQHEDNMRALEHEFREKLDFRENPPPDAPMMTTLEQLNFGARIIELEEMMTHAQQQYLREEDHFIENCITLEKEEERILRGVYAGLKARGKAKDHVVRSHPTILDTLLQKREKEKREREAHEAEVEKRNAAQRQYEEEEAAAAEEAANIDEDEEGDSSGEEGGLAPGEKGDGSAGGSAPKKKRAAGRPLLKKTKGKGKGNLLGEVMRVNQSRSSRRRSVSREKSSDGSAPGTAIASAEDAPSMIVPRRAGRALRPPTDGDAHGCGAALPGVGSYFRPFLSTEDSVWETPAVPQPSVDPLAALNRAVNANRSVVSAGPSLAALDRSPELARVSGLERSREADFAHFAYGESAAAREKRSELRTTKLHRKETQGRAAFGFAGARGEVNWASVGVAGSCLEMVQSWGQGQPPRWLLDGAVASGGVSAVRVAQHPRSGATAGAKGDGALRGALPISATESARLTAGAEETLLARAVARPKESVMVFRGRCGWRLLETLYFERYNERGVSRMKEIVTRKHHH